MRWHVRHILPAIAEQYRSGGQQLCSDDDFAIVLAHYNRINEILMNKEDWPGSDDHICIPVFYSTFALPPRFESIKAFRVNGEALPILPLGFQYLQGGPGILTPCINQGAMQHLGSYFATMRDPPRPLAIFAASDANEEGVTINIHGIDAMGRSRREEITVQRAYPDISPQCTRTAFSSITAIQKPLTAGHIELGAWDDNTGEALWLSSLEPGETNPSVTRYLLPGVRPEYPCHLIANVSLAYREVSNIDDVSLIQHREAYRLMTQALSAFDSGHPDVGSHYQNTAMKLLKGRAAKITQGQSLAVPFQPPRQFRRPIGVRGYE